MLALESPWPQGSTSWLSLPSAAHGGWLWRWDDGTARWSRLWCVLEGCVLLCYAETYADVEIGALAPPEPASGGGAQQPAAAVPVGVNLESPLLALWPFDGTVRACADSVNAPADAVFELHVAGGRCHRLCSHTAPQRAQWIKLLTKAPRVDAEPAVGAGGAGGASGAAGAAGAVSAVGAGGVIGVGGMGGAGGCVFADAGRCAVVGTPMGRLTPSAGPSVQRSLLSQLASVLGTPGAAGADLSSRLSENSGDSEYFDAEVEQAGLADEETHNAPRVW